MAEQPTTSSKPPKSPRPPQKRIGLLSGVGSRDFELMMNAQAHVKRGPDGAIVDDQAAPSGGAFAGQDAGQPAFPVSPEAFGDQASGG